MSRDNEGHYIMIKRSTQEKDITIVNIYAPNIGAPQYIRQTLTAVRGEIDSNTVTVCCYYVGVCNTPLPSRDSTTRQKIKDTQASNNTLKQTDLTDLYRAF